MLNLKSKFGSGSMADGWRRLQESLAALGAQRRCAVRLDAVADRLLSMAARIERLHAHMNSGHISERMAADGSLRGSLKSHKEDIREIRCQLAGLQGPVNCARLLRAFARLSKVAEDTYAAADQLQWQIDEHERLVVRH
jgi:hypothetical protein